jgi:hypothetical protein
MILRFSLLNCRPRSPDVPYRQKSAKASPQCEEKQGHRQVQLSSLCLYSSQFRPSLLARRLVLASKKDLTKSRISQ